MVYDRENTCYSNGAARRCTYKLNTQLNRRLTCDSNEEHKMNIKCGNKTQAILGPPAGASRIEYKSKREKSNKTSNKTDSCSPISLLSTIKKEPFTRELIIV